MTDVIIRVRLDEDLQAWLEDMVPRAVSNALSRAARDITAYAKDIVPVRTGRLRDSVKVVATDKAVHILWDPVDPESGYHYAKVVDIGRAGGRIITPRGNYPLHFKVAGQDIYTWRVTQGPMTGAQYSEHMRIVAPQFVREAIINEFQGMSQT